MNCTEMFRKQTGLGFRSGIYYVILFENMIRVGKFTRKGSKLLPEHLTVAVVERSANFTPLVFPEQVYLQSNKSIEAIPLRLYNRVAGPLESSQCPLLKSD